MDAQKYLDGLVTQSETEGVPFEPGDVFAPVHSDGRSDLNLHMADMLAEPDVTQDPYAVPGDAR